MSDCIKLFILLTGLSGVLYADKPARTLDCAGDWIIALDYSPDGQLLVSGSDAGEVRIWEMGKSPVVSKLLKKFTSPVTALEFSPDGKSVMVGTWEGGLVLCDREKGVVLKRFEEHQETITAVHYDTTGKYVASGSADDRLIVWDAKSGEVLLEMHQGNEYDVTTLAFSPDGESLVTGDGENQLKVWDAATGEPLKTLKGHAEPVSKVAYDAKGRVVSGSWDDTIRIWEEGGEKVLEGHAGDITALEVGVAGRRIYSASEDRTVRVWDEQGKAVVVLRGASESLRCMAVRADGKRVVAGSKGVILEWLLAVEAK